MPDDMEKVQRVEYVEWRRPIRRRTRLSIACAIVLYFSIRWLWCFLTNTSSEIPPPTPEIPKDATYQALCKDWDKRPSENEVHALYEMGKTQSSWMSPTGPTSDWVDVLGRMISLLLDQQTEDLLRPIEATGEARLHELAVRTRHFRKMYEAWEEVHSDPSEDPSSFYMRGKVKTYIQNHPEIAAELGMSTEKLGHLFEEYESVMNNLSSTLFPWTLPYPTDLMKFHVRHYEGGKGIVFLTGDLHAPMLLTSIPIIRKLGCNLPIEVFFYGNLDLSWDVREQLETLPGVIARGINFLIDSGDWQLDFWAGKPWAMLLSSFREVMFIDADSLFFQNPEKLFNDEIYLQTGALFFKDRMIAPESKRQFLQNILPQPISDKAQESRFWTGESGHMQESGVVVVNKWKHFVTLLLVARLNGPDRNGDSKKRTVGVYDMIFGDKETFWLGWEMAGNTDYAFHNGSTGTMGMVHEEDTVGFKGKILIATDSVRYKICAPQLLHLDRDGRPLWFNGWLLPTKWDKDKEPAKFEAFLQEPIDQQKSPWELREHNVCCLTSGEKMKFMFNETEVLENIIATGRVVGALAKVE